jgi:hypothetical protein
VLAYFLQCESISTSFTNMSIKKCTNTEASPVQSQKHQVITRAQKHQDLPRHGTKTPRHAETWHKNTKTSPVLIKTCHKNTKTSPVLIKSTRKHQGVTCSI